jgi:hypothetical protein
MLGGMGSGGTPVGAICGYFFRGAARARLPLPPAAEVQHSLRFAAATRGGSRDLRSEEYARAE